ncbi:TetR/AcrR family transcriptional regulator [Jiangella anatolica]|uniref:TetR family transcriptional regulator n=1 Tax=Jiangella anatolica TaxID=2670374 RepID=A0A2W2C975_9ACTN|nr:TetR/AcrR family transcriptional regulator [Jiangella anatolica]PZF82366.1 TetR family transcriptional regulator [Jiangella anatolica]
MTELVPRREGRKRNAATTSERIRRTALELFSTQGYEATGIRELADRVGMTTASLYHYVGTKAELLTDIMRDAQARLLAAAQGALAGIDDPAARIVRLVHIHVLAHAIFQLEARTVDTELRVLDPSALQEILDARDEYEQLWREAIVRGCDDGVFTVPDASTARLAIMTMSTGVAHWYKPNRGASPAELAVNFSDLALALLRATDAAGRTVDTAALALGDPAELIPLLGIAPPASTADAAR